MHIRSLLRTAAAPVLFTAMLSVAAAKPPRVSRPYAYSFEGVLGTSLDLTFVAYSESDAQAAERATLNELTRISRVISTWDPESEVSGLIRQGHLDHPSRELLEVFRDYEHWGEQSGHAFTARAGELSGVWRTAERAGHLPADSTLRRVVREVAAPA